MSELTAKLNERGIEYIRSQIEKKNSMNPYMATGKAVENVITDMDHQPYTRFFRGVYYYDTPVIMEREAGYRPIRNSCYNVNRVYEPEPLPKIAFESACSTIFPVNPDKYQDKRLHDDWYSNTCIVQYR